LNAKAGRITVGFGVAEFFCAEWTVEMLDRPPVAHTEPARNFLGGCFIIDLCLRQF